MLIEILIISVLANFLSLLLFIWIIATIYVFKKDDIVDGVENKVDEKVEEKAQEMMGGLF